MTKNSIQITQGIPAKLKRIREDEVHALQLKAKAEKHRKSFKSWAVFNYTPIIKEMGENHYHKKLIGEYLYGFFNDGEAQLSVFHRARNPGSILYRGEDPPVRSYFGS